MSDRTAAFVEAMTDAINRIVDGRIAKRLGQSSVDVRAQPHEGNTILWPSEPHAEAVDLPEMSALTFACNISIKTNVASATEAEELVREIDAVLKRCGRKGDWA
ncbi:MAG: hypothetical protein WBA46_11415 [Thermomicrobiales bacterium]